MNPLRVNPFNKHMLLMSLGLVTGFMLVPYNGVCQHETTTWGAATNGIRLGVKVYLTDSWGRGQFPLVHVNVQNVSTHKIVFSFASVEHRYQMELLGPDGQRLDLLSEDLAAAIKHKRRPVSLLANEIDQVDYFFVSDVFGVKTNGSHTLVVSERATTNNIRVRSPTYFLFPPVTNTFNVVLPKVKNSSGTGHKRKKGVSEVSVNGIDRFFERARRMRRGPQAQSRISRRHLPSPFA